MGLLISVLTVRAQNNLSVYSDALDNGFQDWGWATHNYANTAPVHSGADSVSVTIATTNYDGLQIYHSDFDSSPYASLSFWINGGSSGGQRLQFYGLLHVGTNANVGQLHYSLAALPTNTWQQITIPLASLGVANTTHFTGFVIQSSIGAVQPTFYLDDIQLNAVPAPALISLSVNTTQALRTVDSRWFGVNLAMWDANFDTMTTAALLNEMGTRIVRLPGGSLSDEYHWASNTTLTNTWQWANSFASFAHIFTNASVRAQTIITVNYGTGTPAEAAAWVRNANVTNQFGCKYWEVGNECYGTWETDTNTYPHDGYTYAVRAAAYIAQMKAADPTIKIGVPVVTGENSSINGYTSHPIYNARTGQTNYGWTPVVLATLKSLNTTPDFLVYHVYPEYGMDSDQALLQDSANWAPDAADLRQQITDYFGSGGTNIQLFVTENNADAGSQGRQSTSIVDGLYYADSLGQVMKTEFNAFVWWDFRNGTDTTGDFSPSLYGWRNYGDLGMVNGLSSRHPTFYAAKLMARFAHPGDSVLNVASTYQLLSAYAIRHTDGSISVLGLNKDATTNLNGQIQLNGFVPGTTASVYSYGMAQDEATRTNAVYALQDIATNALAGVSNDFTFSFPPYSMTMITLPPAAPGLQSMTAAGGQYVFQVQGQSGVPYQIQNSTDLVNWTSNATVTLPGATGNLTNSISAGAQFWRAVWLP